MIAELSRQSETFPPVTHFPLINSAHPEEIPPVYPLVRVSGHGAGTTLSLTGGPPRRAARQYRSQGLRVEQVALKLAAGKYQLSLVTLGKYAVKLPARARR